MEKEFLGKTQNNKDVYLNLVSSHALTHIAKTPRLLEFVKAVIPTIIAQESIIRLDKDMGEVVGKTDLVETSDHDEIIYAKRPLRAQYSRFVKNKQSPETSWITIDLRKSGENTYDLYTAFVGKLTPSFPGGDFLSDQSKGFWSNHALVWGGQEIIPGTETAECPW